jgi:hypothetical protein
MLGAGSSTWLRAVSLSFVEGGGDPALGDLVLTFEALGVDAEQDPTL